MRFYPCVMVLAVCLVACNCAANGEPSEELVQVKEGENGVGLTTTTTAVLKIPDNPTNNQPQPGPKPAPAPEPEPEPEPEIVVKPPQVVVATTTTTTTNKAQPVDVTETHTGPEPEKQDRDSLHLSHGAQNPDVPMQPKSPSKPEYEARAQPPPKIIPKKTVPASGSEEQDSIHRDVKTVTGEVKNPSGEKITGGQGQSTAVKDPDAPPKDSLDKAGGIHTHKMNDPSAGATTTSTAQATEKKNKNAEKTTTTTVSPTTAISSVQTTSLQQESKLVQSAINKDGSKSTSLLIAFATLVTLSVIHVAPAY